MGPADAEQTFTVQGCEAVSQTLCATEQHLGMSEPSRMRKEPTYCACFPRGISFLSHLKGTKVLTHLNSSPRCNLAKRTANKNCPLDLRARAHETYLLHLDRRSDTFHLESLLSSPVA